MAPEHVEDGGIVVVQQKTGKELWVPVHPDLRRSLEVWRSSPYVVNGRGVRFTAERFRATWADLMPKMPAGRIRDEGFVFHGPAHRAARSSVRSAATIARSALSIQPLC